MAFNQEDDAEATKAIEMLKDMQKRGYAILVRMPDDTYVRATSIDASSGRYVIQMPVGGIETLPAEATVHTCACGCGAEIAPDKTWKLGHHKRKPGGTVRASVPVRSSRAVGVARSAGG